MASATSCGLSSIALAAWLSLVACDTSDPNDVKRMPKPPPSPGQMNVPSMVQIEVVKEGRVATPIDGAKLDATAPDYHDDERRAWNMTTLLGGEAGASGSTISATGEKGLILTMKVPEKPGDPEPVLVVSRRGEIIAALIEPGSPFPAFHGRGGRLGRRGDPLPRIAGVTKLELARAK